MNLGYLEQEILEELWQTGEPLTVREVYEALNTQRSIAYTTVMTVLTRLAKKQLVTRQTQGRAFRYRAAYTKAELTARAMLSALEATDPGSRSTALQHFVGQLDPEEIVRIQETLESNAARPKTDDSAS